jgi:hypothetical protein
MNSWLGEALSEFRALLRRGNVVELLVAFAGASAAVALLAQVVNGFVYTPITQAADDGSFGDDNGVFGFVIGGRVFQGASVFTTGLVLCLVVLLGSILVKLRDGDIWEDGAVQCPHCLFDVPSSAVVCAYCTRDLPKSQG